jgi:DNA polymerase-3 subunit epsilon
MKWLLAGPLGCWDSETTGINVYEDRIVTATVGTLTPGTPWQVDTRSWLIDPGVDIPEAATAVHGITTVQAKEHGEQPAGALNDVAFRLARLFLAGTPVIGMNIVFDFTILDRELRRHDLPTLDERLGYPISPVVDVLVLDKFVDPYRKGGRKLTDLCEFYGVRLDGAHDSAFDALAAARIAYRMAQRADFTVEQTTHLYAQLGRKKPAEIAARFAELGAMSPAELHEAQVGWRREQCDGLREYFDNRGQKHDGVPGDWPMIPHRAEVAHVG